MSLSDVIAAHRLLVCVGGGGVGKTTVSAALALGAAAAGRRAVVLTIDPARALCRALGMSTLGADPERVSDSTRPPDDEPFLGTLDAAMLDRKRAWDCFIRRHAPAPTVARAVLDNAFYQELSSHFAGGAEYVAMEEVCRLYESGRWDVVVLDTPPSAGAFDFVTAPDRINRLLDPELARWLVQPTLTLGRGTARATGATVRFLVRRLQRATGRQTLGEIAAFLTALGGMVDELRERSRRARELLRSQEAAFILVTGPRRQALDQAEPLVESIRSLEIPLRAVVLNRAHPMQVDVSPARARVDVATLLRGPALAGYPEPVLAWLTRVYQDALVLADLEQRRADRFFERLPRDVARATVPELDRDLHTLADLARVAREVSGVWDRPRLG